MIDCIEAIAAPQTATAYVRPSAMIFTVEGGRHVLYVVRGREEALRLIAEKRAQTRDERYALTQEIIEASVLPERSEAPTVTIAVTDAVLMIMQAAFDVMPHLERLHGLVYADTPRLDAFVLPRSHEAGTGFGVIRTHAGPLLETFHSREQAVGFLKRHEAVIDEADMEMAGDEFGYSPLASRSARAPQAFGGFAAAVIGARYRMLTELGRVF